MKAVDRIMAAYARTHKLTEAQADMVRKELSLFIDHLLFDEQPESAKDKIVSPQL
jgi:hypothetical protein